MPEMDTAMSQPFLHPEQMARIRAGQLTESDRERLDAICTGYFESSDQCSGSPGAGSLWEVTSSLSLLIQKAAFTADDGEAILDCLSSAHRLLLDEQARTA